MLSRYPTKQSSQKGFTLIETSILITVLSLILVPLFIYLQTEQVRKELYEQENVNDRVLSAISLFLQQNGRYPCPADPAAAMGAAGFGLEKIGGTGFGTANVYIGSIPVKSLNISVTDSMNKDGWRYIYAVSAEKCDSRNTGNPNRITILNAANASIGTAPFVIVNPGKDAKGARNINGQLSAIECVPWGAAAADAENCDDDATFREGMYSVAQLPNQAGFYDDSIVYSLATSETTMWKIKERVITTTPTITVDPGKIDIVTRSTGSIGIGTDNPTAKLQVVGGNMQVMRDNATGGMVDLDNGNVTANVDVNSDEVISDTGAESPAFYYDTP